MELALYCPVYGYYEAEKDTPGRRGDFYTSVSVGRLFGELLACRFTEWLAPNGARQIVEAGAHDGCLAKDILNWLRRHQPALFERVEYHIIEPSPGREQRQRQTLVEFDRRVCWSSDLSAATGSRINGVIFSNELLDAMPVHRFAWDAKQARWFEWGVTVGEGRLEWIRMEPGELGAIAKLASQIPEELSKVLPDGFELELSPAAERWWLAAAAALQRGKLLTIDYGWTWDELVAPERSKGTLRAYYQHQTTRDVLARPGVQDITASVNFSLIRKAGEAAGLRTESFISQAKFLTQIAVESWKASSRAWGQDEVRQFQTLTHPEHLGERFRVLLQARE